MVTAIVKVERKPSPAPVRIASIPYYLKVKRKRKRRTPSEKRWYTKSVHMGWRKTQPAEVRRSLALEAHEGDLLATARALQALANVTTDTETKRLAKLDADYFFMLYRKKRGGSHGCI